MIEHADAVRAVFMSETDPELDAEHGKLIRALRTTFLPIESGAPGIDVEFPFGPEVDVVGRALTLLSTSDRQHAVRILAETGRILPHYIARAQLAPGCYAVPEELARWPGVGRDRTFQLTAEHITLLKGALWTVVDRHIIASVLEMETLWPMPYIDGKYPYGERSYFQLDMAELLGEPYQIAPDDYAVDDDEKDQRLENLHIQMRPALQVFLANAALPN